MRIATWDIETTHLKPNFGVVLCGAIKEYGKEPKLYAKKEKGKNDKALICTLRDELEKYDILVSYFGLNFDLKFLNSKLTARSRKYSTHRPGALLPLQSISISQASLALPQSYGWKRVTMAVRRHLKRLWSTISGMLSS
jgi:hypothetical protein